MKDFIGFCFQCKKNSSVREEFYKRGICIMCHNDYFKKYMREYNKTNYRYKSKWQQIIESELPINV